MSKRSDHFDHFRRGDGDTAPARVGTHRHTTRLPDVPDAWRCHGVTSDGSRCLSAGKPRDKDRVGVALCYAHRSQKPPFDYSKGASVKDAAKIAAAKKRLDPGPL